MSSSASHIDWAPSNTAVIFEHIACGMVRVYHETSLRLRTPFLPFNAMHPKPYNRQTNENENTMHPRQVHQFTQKNTQHAHEPSAPILISLTTKQTNYRTIARCIPSASLFFKSARRVTDQHQTQSARAVEHSASLLSPNMRIATDWKSKRKTTRHDPKSTTNITWNRVCSEPSSSQAQNSMFYQTIVFFFSKFSTYFDSESFTVMFFKTIKDNKPRHTKTSNWHDWLMQRNDTHTHRGARARVRIHLAMKFRGPN